MRSEQINELAAALAKAQGQVKAALKDTANAHLRTRYADLASVWTACREALSANGLAVVQCPSFDGDLVTVETTLTHSSGQWWSSILSAPPPTGQGNPTQQMGAGIAYLRRFALMAMVGVAPDDDDGNGDPASVAQQLSGPPPEQERREFQPSALLEAKAKILAAATVEECDALTPWLHKQKWKNAAERKEAGALFQARRAALAVPDKVSEACRACDAPAGKPHAPGCPEDPANTKAGA